MIRLRILAVVLGATASLCMLTPAYAETIDLTCSNNRAGLGRFVSIDTVANTVAFWNSNATRREATVVPATITEGEVTWGVNQPRLINYVLDRNTGALHMAGSQDTGSFTCKKAARVF